MNTPIDNAYIGVTTPHFRAAADFYIQHFSYSLVADHGDFVSVKSPNGKRCIGFSAATATIPPICGVSLTFLVDDVEIALEQFKSSSVTVTREIGTGTWGVPHFVITDPAGVEIYVSERSSKAEQCASATP